MGRALLGLARAHPEEALELARQAQRRAPKSALVRFQVAGLLTVLGHLGEARSEYPHARKLDANALLTELIDARLETLNPGSDGAGEG